MFGFAHSSPLHSKTPWNTGYIIALCGIFGVISIYHTLANLRLNNMSSSSLSQQLGLTAQLTRGRDAQMSKAIRNIDHIYQTLQSGGDSTKESYLTEVMEYLTSSGSKLAIRVTPQYRPIINVLSQISQFPTDIMSLVGGRQTYLILLQNMAEKRPNGGFFGSYMVVHVSGGQIVDHRVYDSYYPQYINPKFYITAPDRSQHFLLNNQIQFVSANKFGFTDVDGAHIARLYEAIFGEPVRGVIFLQSDLVTKLVPGFDKQLIERQFLNACVDLIRKSNSPNKKEFYLTQVSDAIRNNKDKVLKKLVTHTDELLQGKIQMYLKGIGSGLQNRLQDNQLTTVFQTGHLYLRDTNIGYNKIDSFVTKITQITSSSGLTQEYDGDVINLTGMSAGTYRVLITYSLNVPDHYLKYITSLATKYNITLTSREQHILGLDRVHDTRGVITTDRSIILQELTGDIITLDNGSDPHLFQTPQSNNAVYRVQSIGNHLSRRVAFTLILP